MAILTSSVLTPPLHEAQRPECVQPGGGFCLNLELGWGRWRRRFLRLYRPAYVRRMAERRQGDCPNCPHDIVDARDLKFVRNVCGYWFRGEDNPFRWRGRLGLARWGLAEVICFSMAFLLATIVVVVAGWMWHWGFWLLLIPVLGLWFESVWFFRDPERAIPADSHLLLSPADGTITHLEEVEEPGFAGGRAFRISIFLSVFNVHVNRMPRAGRVTAVRYFPGAFLDARKHESAARNEQLWVDMEELPSRRPIRIKQISGAIARRIVCQLRPGDEIKKGERFGMIKYGSRTDVLIPASENIEIMVKVGTAVRGGATPLLRFLDPPPSTQQLIGADH